MNKTSVLIVGAGPGGLSAAITLKHQQPQAEICVIDKAAEPGNHNMSGATLEADALATLLEQADRNWRQSEQAKEILGYKVEKDNVMFFAGKNFAFNLAFSLKPAKALGIGFGQMSHQGNHIVSVSKLTKWLCKIAKDMGVEVLHGFSAEDIIYDAGKNIAAGVKLVDQGLDKHGNKHSNYVAGEIINADAIVLAEGCDGLVTEKFIDKAGLVRKSKRLYSVGVKELIKVSDEQFKKFTAERVVHAMGWPLWTPVLGPAMFGGGVMYPVSQNHISVGMIVGLDWKYCDFNPQDALTNFKNHGFVKKFIDGGTIVEAGAKMIPEGGLCSIPRDAGGYIGKANCIIAGDSAGFVNMLKVKGLHNAIDSGIQAAKAIHESLSYPRQTAARYTTLINCSNIAKEMESARNFRQTVARLGPLFGMPLSVLGGLLPKFKID